MHTHPHAIVGSFDYVKKVDDANVVVIPYGVDEHGAQIVDRPVIRTPTILPAPTSNMPGTGTSPNPDPNAALLQGVLAAMQTMTQVHIQSDQRNACMSRQQAQLQAATLQSNAQQLEHVTNHLGNLGYEVGRAISTHPTRHSRTLQATLSHPNTLAGQSTDPRVLGSLTRTIPVSMSLSTFNYGPYVQAYQPQPNDKNTRCIDKATHQIIQRHIPSLVKVRYDAAHTSGVVLPVSDYLDGFHFAVESAVGKQHMILWKCWWHTSLGTGCITNSGFVLQPNIQEQDFGRYAPTLEGLDPSMVRGFYIDLCRVAHGYGIYMPAYEEFRPEDTFSRIECSDMRTACVPKFCQSLVPQWQAIIHHHLKRDKVIPSTHPQAGEIKHNPNGYEALSLLITPYHPGFVDNGILIKPHPQQGKRSRDDHFRCCEFYYYEQQCFLGTCHNWTDALHMIRFLDSCQNANVLRTMYNQERHVPAMQYKFKRERIVATLKEYMASPSFALLGGRPTVTSAHPSTRAASSNNNAVTTLTTRPAGSNTRCRFSHSNGDTNGGGGTQRSGNTGRSPRDCNGRALEASTESFDDDSSVEPAEDFIMAKLNGECLGGCNVDHPTYECPNIVGDLAQQKKTFASLSSKQRSLPIRAITATKSDNDDVDLIDLHDPEDHDSDMDQDFP